MIPGLSRADIDSYVDQVQPHVKALIVDQLKEMPTKVIMTSWIRSKKPVKSAITLDPEDASDAEM